MSTTNLFIILGVLIVVFYLMYVSLIKKKNKVEEALSSVDVQLKKRYDLVPNILKIADKFMEHEKYIFEEIAKIRTKAMAMADDFEGVNEKLKLDNLLKEKISQLNVSLENYPDLKSDKAVVSSIQIYNDTEENIAAARRFYNSAALSLNNAVEIFPSSVVALMLGIKKRAFFEAEDAERKSINVDNIEK